jgi:hypothetical protein
MSEFRFDDQEVRDPEIPDAGDRTEVKEKGRASKRRDEAGYRVLRQIMGSNEGRAWMYALLEQCHLTKTSFSRNALDMAFEEGERNIGLRIMGDLMKACPERYIEMQKEANGERS